MKTPHVQAVVDAVEAKFAGRVRVGGWDCRRIDGTLKWSQHSWTENPETGVIYAGNAADLFPDDMATGDQIAAYVRGLSNVKVVLWRVKNHFDHVHVDTWPTGIGKPPCKGGALRVQYEDGRIGRTFQEEDMPLTDADKEWIRAAISHETREALNENVKLSQSHNVLVGPIFGDPANPAPEQAWNRTNTNVEDVEQATGRIEKLVAQTYKDVKELLKRP